VGKKYLFILQILLAILTVLTVYARQSGSSVILLWPALWLVIAVTIINVFYLPPNYRVPTLIILAACIAFIRLAALPKFYLLGGDEVFEAQVGSLIVKSGYWDPKLGSGFAENYYGYNPVLHFILAMVSTITGLNSYTVMKFFLPILYKILIMLLTFIVIKNFISNEKGQLSYIATLVFIGSTGFAFIGVTRRSTAAIFVLLSIFSIIKEEQSYNKLLWNILFMIFSVFIVLANRSISFYFLIFLFGAFLFSKLIRYIFGMRDRKIFPDITPKLIYFTLVLATWQIAFADVFIVEDLLYINQIKDIALGIEGISSFLRASGEPVKVNIYRSYETLLIYGSQFLFLILGGIGFLFFLYHTIKFKGLMLGWIDHNYFFLYFSIFGFIMYFFSALLMRTTMDVAVTIVLWFFVIPIAIFSASILDKLIMRGRITAVLSAVLIIFMISASLLMGTYTPRITNRAPGEDIVAGYDVRSLSKSLYYSGLWLRNSTNSSSKAKVLGDWDVHSVFSGFFGFDVNPYKLWMNALYKGNNQDILGMIYKQDFEFGSYIHTHHYDKLDYFVINKALINYPNLTFGDNVNLDNCKTLDSIPLLDKVYTNEDVLIYKIERGESLD
jgi:hypothetical protein